MKIKKERIKPGFYSLLLCLSFRDHQIEMCVVKIQNDFLEGDYKMPSLRILLIYFALIISWRLVIDGFSKFLRSRSSRTTPVRSNFFLNFFSALSMLSLSLTATINMFIF